MGSSTDHLAKVTSEPQSSESCDLNDAATCKQRLKETARGIDPLQPLREHPITSVVTAAAVGFVAGSPEAARSIHSFLSAGLTRSLIRVINWQIARHKAARAESPPTS
ncbi:MAG TPA: hypothetical protein VHD56_10570 [Tepidisphaeraceae bacterium]|nr:hypothetical protein [Tepidisphaeraceae bacterium]